MSTLLETSRLLLRAPAVGDAPTLVQLAGRPEIADTTISIPHPYTEQHALDWIQSAKGNLAARSHSGSGRKSTASEKESFNELLTTTRRVNFVVTLRSTPHIIGAVGLREIDTEHSQAELGMWIGVDHWGHGYATEAVSEVVRHAFEAMELNRVYAHHMVRNPSSGRVLEKVGFHREGILRQRVRKWGLYEDVVILAILKTSWLQQHRKENGRGGEI